MYNFYADAGHSWLRVQREELRTLGILDKITCFSYQKGNHVFLEQDLDMDTFIKVKGQVKIKRHHSNWSRIRSYQAFK